MNTHESSINVCNVDVEFIATPWSSNCLKRRNDFKNQRQKQKRNYFKWKE